MKPPFLAAAVQAVPAFLDLDAAIAKTVALIEQAGARGVRLLAFPEAWIPGYPFWIWSVSPLEAISLSRLYHEASVAAGSKPLARICEAARCNGVHVVLGLSERDHSSLYLGQTIIGADGCILAQRRKPRPTHVERNVFGDGDGSDLAVHDTPVGRLGALNCWEHLQPLVRAAMFAQHEEVHVAGWPSLAAGASGNPAYALGRQVNLAASQVYAAEGGCYVLAATQVVDESVLRVQAQHLGRDVPFPLGGGCSMIYGPDGRALADFLPEDAEGLVVAEIDLGTIAFAKALADPVGHYARPDALRLIHDRTRWRAPPPDDADSHAPGAKELSA
mgnify:CR=1 FL=1